MAQVQGLRGMSAGIPIVMRDSGLRFLAAAYISNAAAVTALQAVLVVAAAQRFGHDTAVGWLYAAVGAGSLLGTIPVIRKTPDRVGTAPIIAATRARARAAGTVRLRHRCFPLAVAPPLPERDRSGVVSDQRA